MASVPSDREGFLWALIESRDRAFARAHEAFQAMTREAREKDREIQRLTAWARELEVAPRQKDAEIERITEMAALRQRLLDKVQGSLEYKLGLLILRPRQVLTWQLRKKRL
jgi:hypothetical protein